MREKAFHRKFNEGASRGEDYSRDADERISLPTVDTINFWEYRMRQSEPNLRYLSARYDEARSRYEAYCWSPPVAGFDARGSRAAVLRFSMDAFSRELDAAQELYDHARHQRDLAISFLESAYRITPVKARDVARKGPDRIVKLPGTLLASFAEFLVGKRARQTRIDPCVADMHFEYFEALHEEKKWTARSVLVRGRVNIVAHIFQSLPMIRALYRVIDFVRKLVP